MIPERCPQCGQFTLAAPACHRCPGPVLVARARRYRDSSAMIGALLVGLLAFAVALFLVSVHPSGI
jgi:uncharacterized protein (DUF983 family)